MSTSPAATTSRPLPATVLQPIGVTVLVATVSLAALFALIEGVLATGGGIPALVAVLVVSAGALAVLLRLLFARLGSRSGWPTAVVIATADVIVYAAVLVTGTQAPSIASLRPEAAILCVALASGAAASLMLGGWWRVLGVCGMVGLLWIALTPLLVTL